MSCTLTQHEKPITKRWGDIYTVKICNDCGCTISQPELIKGVKVKHDLGPQLFSIQKDYDSTVRRLNFGKI
jgi:hypothetical protein